jgi:hypothetical protein
VTDPWVAHYQTTRERQAVATAVEQREGDQMLGRLKPKAMRCNTGSLVFVLSMCALDTIVEYA